MTAHSIRARVRAEMTNEIKAIAKRRLAADGANLSLRAIARDLGVVSSAIYRYFGSRDELLTALIIDAYNDLGQAVEEADAAAPPDDLLRRWLAVANAARDWAIAVPHEYLLIYGSPVPDYQAPPDTITPAVRSTMVLGGILAHGVCLGALRDTGEQLPGPLSADIERLRNDIFPTVPATLLVRGMTAWIELFGAISFELGGQFTNVITERRVFFDHVMRGMAGYIGIS